MRVPPCEFRVRDGGSSGPYWLQRVVVDVFFDFAKCGAIPQVTIVHPTPNLRKKAVTSVVKT